MNATAIDYIWKAIQESERNDDLQFLDDVKRIRVAANGLAQSQPDQSGAMRSESSAETAISPNPVDNDSLQADSHTESGRSQRAASSE